MPHSKRGRPPSPISIPTTGIRNPKTVRRRVAWARTLGVPCMNDHQHQCCIGADRPTRLASNRQPERFGICRYFTHPQSKSDGSKRTARVDNPPFHATSPRCLGRYPGSSRAFRRPRRPRLYSECGCRLQGSKAGSVLFCVDFAQLVSGGELQRDIGLPGITDQAARFFANFYLVGV